MFKNKNKKKKENRNAINTNINIVCNSHISNIIKQIKENKITHGCIISLEGKMIGDGDVAKLAKYLPKLCLYRVKLILKNNCITNKGAMILAEAFLKCGSGSIIIDLNCNLIERDGHLALYNAVQSCGRDIKFTIEHNIDNKTLLTFINTNSIKRNELRSKEIAVIVLCALNAASSLPLELIRVISWWTYINLTNNPPQDSIFKNTHFLAKLPIPLGNSKTFLDELKEAICKNTQQLNCLPMNLKLKLDKVPQLQLSIKSLDLQGNAVIKALEDYYCKEIGLIGLIIHCEKNPRLFSNEGTKLLVIGAPAIWFLAIEIYNLDPQLVPDAIKASFTSIPSAKTPATNCLGMF